MNETGIWEQRCKDAEDEVEFEHSRFKAQETRADRLELEAERLREALEHIVIVNDSTPNPNHALTVEWMRDRARRALNRNEIPPPRDPVKTQRYP